MTPPQGKPLALHEKLLSRLERYCARQLSKRGLKVKRPDPIDLRPQEPDPKAWLLQESRQLYQPTVLEVPLERARSTLGASFDASHPFVATVHQPAASLEDTPLFRHFQAFQPTSAAEALGVPPDGLPGFTGLSPLAFLMPWQAQAPTEIVEMRREWMEEQARRQGLALQARDGFNHFGPASAKKLQLEVDRLVRLQRSIAARGLTRHAGRDGDITGWLLIQEDGTWCVQVISGQHRTAVAAALGHSTLPVRFSHAPIKREEVAYWPQVSSGRMTPNAALAIFDRVMQGRCPSQAGG